MIFPAGTIMPTIVGAAAAVGLVAFASIAVGDISRAGEAAWAVYSAVAEGSTAGALVGPDWEACVSAGVIFVAGWQALMMVPATNSQASQPARPARLFCREHIFFIRVMMLQIILDFAMRDIYSSVTPQMVTTEVLAWSAGQTA